MIILIEIAVQTFCYNIQFYYLLSDVQFWFDDDSAVKVRNVKYFPSMTVKFATDKSSLTLHKFTMGHIFFKIFIFITILDQL